MTGLVVLLLLVAFEWARRWKVRYERTRKQLHRIEWMLIDINERSKAWHTDTERVRMQMAHEERLRREEFAREHAKRLSLLSGTQDAGGLKNPDLPWSGK